METIFKTNTNQLDNKFLDVIKSLFKDQDIEISIRNVDETAYLLSNKANREHIFSSVAEYQNEKTTSFTLEEFYHKYEKSIGNE